MEEEDQHFGTYESSYENKDTVNTDTQQGLKISSILMLFLFSSYKFQLKIPSNFQP